MPLRRRNLRSKARYTSWRNRLKGKGIIFIDDPCGSGGTVGIRLLSDKEAKELSLLQDNVMRHGVVVFVTSRTHEKDQTGHILKGKAVSQEHLRIHDSMVWDWYPPDEDIKPSGTK